MAVACLLLRFLVLFFRRMSFSPVSRLILLSNRQIENLPQRKQSQMSTVRESTCIPPVRAIFLRRQLTVAASQSWSSTWIIKL
jgi:hypothetical protein